MAISARHAGDQGRLPGRAAGPVTVLPVLDAKPWGGRRLETCGISLPAGDMIGEAHLAAPGAVVAAGPLAGRTLEDLTQRDPTVWAGARGLAVTGGRAIFPLLVKLIDANTDLSIQVHPDDDIAAAADLGTGKTEAWHIVAARPGSVLFVGLRDGVTAEMFKEDCRRGDGSASRCLRQIPAEEGMTVLVPAGTPHAIGAGVLLYEIQQPSNVTFRLDDWGRTDHTGQPRALHHEQGFSALDATLRPDPITPIPLRRAGPQRDLLAATRYFALERLGIDAGDRVELPELESPQVLSCVDGGSSLDAGDAALALRAGETAILPSGWGAALEAEHGAVVLRGWVPDLEMDVIGPAKAAGASSEAIARLGIETGCSRRRFPEKQHPA